MSQTIIDVKEAAQIAAAYVADLLSQDRLQDIRLEEVELSEDGDSWLVTIGFSRPELTKYALEILGGKLNREYRQVKIQAKDGRVMSHEDKKPLSAELEKTLARHLGKSVLIDSNLLVP